MVDHNGAKSRLHLTNMLDYKMAHEQSQCMMNSTFKKTVSPSVNVQAIADTIKLFIHKNFSEARLAVLFGSRVYGEQEGDIDFKIFVDNPTVSDRQIVAEFARELNRQHAPYFYESSQKDVPYEVKTIISYSLIDKALQLIPFKTPEGNLKIEPISFSQEFLESQECQMRVILSCFTTPNLCLYGSIEAFNQLCDKAFIAALNLICSAWALPPNDFDKILPFFLSHPDGSEYKSYLGYRNSPQIINHLKKRFKEVTQDP
jgi:hypothetical protein